MTTIDQLIKDAETAIETAKLASKRVGGEQVIKHSFDWLEVIVIKAREAMNETSLPTGAKEK